ncbi:MAG: heterodisulfide reductase-related iron-sulfur binding cluster [Acidimicrobiia bacterium]|nr:heterodisulfide reductase-related iron-sulfur binding cluster [Acidimicrobiia bacterium]
MTTTEHLYDPLGPEYWEEGDVRSERDRTFQVCSDCRICVRYCPSFKDLFRFIDERDDGAHDVKFLSDAQHRQVVDECYQCKLCYIVCPYTPQQGQEWKIDFPRLMLRSLAIQGKRGDIQKGARLLARTDLQGKVATNMSGIVNRTNDVKFVRTMMEKTTGIARDRLLPTFAKVRFTKWFRKERRSSLRPDDPGPHVALFPTCLVEYQDPEIGKAAVEVCEHNGIRCELPEGQVCCGMPWLDAGDVTKFEEHARKNVAVLATAVKGGADVIVPQPTCAYVLKQEYPDFLGTDDARLVAEHTFDVAEYLMARHKEETLDVAFTGPTYETITWQAACHYRAQQIGPKSKQLMELTGAKVTMVERCSAIDGTWGLRAENAEMARRIAKPLMEAVGKAETDLVAGDCQLSNTAIREATGKVPVHPIQVLARAYGLGGGTKQPEKQAEQGKKGE